MRPILLDTNAYTAFKLGDKDIIEILQQTEEIGISPIVLGELLGGFEYGSKPQLNCNELQKFLESSRIRMYAITRDTSNYYSHIYANLKRKGHPIPTNDLWIAAQALENGCILCSYDKHFSAIDTLITIQSVNDLL